MAAHAFDGVFACLLASMLIVPVGALVRAARGVRAYRASMRLAPLGLLTALTCGLAAAQDQGAAEGQALLARMIDAQRKVEQMTADYVQYRSSPLTKKPLTSKGTLAFRRAPGCVVFRVTEPRASVIRLDTAHYEVWHPDKARLERFVLPSDEMPRLLFDALAPTTTSLEKGFVVESCTAVADAATRREITLVPTGVKTKRVAAKITITLDTEGPRLCAFGYRDPRGGDVRVELNELKLTEKADDKLFALDVPKETKVTVQQIPLPKEPATKEEAGASEPTKASPPKAGGKQ